MSQRLISLNPDLKRLRDEGYDVHVRGAYLVLRGVPYVNANKSVVLGTLVSELSLLVDKTIAPATHVIHFVGEHPCDKDGAELTKIKHQTAKTPLGDLVGDHSFSSKPIGGYKDYFEKFTTYVAIISAPAAEIDATVSPRTFPVVVPDSTEPSPFHYLDTASSRAGIATVTQKLEHDRVAIIGVGGTGSYVLDLLAKTPVREIHLFDADTFSQHNAFRSPGAPAAEELQAIPKKVDYLGTIYSRMHRGIVKHPYRLDATNAAELEGMNFVFVCLDSGLPKGPIFAAMEARGIPFIDVGMGIELVDGALGGVTRITASAHGRRAHVGKRVSLGDATDDDYHQNIQVADLNALNAALAVIRWKRFCGFYRDLEQEYHSTYTIDGNKILNDEQL
jgi:hypothetical protein